MIRRVSYRPNMGFAAARIDVRAFNVAWIPALVMEVVCCSMASWMAAWGEEGGGRERRRKEEEEVGGG